MVLKMRKKGDKEWEDRDMYLLPGESMDDFDLQLGVECFAEEMDLDVGDVVEVYRKGKWCIEDVYIEKHYTAVEQEK